MSQNAPLLLIKKNVLTFVKIMNSQNYFSNTSPLLQGKNQNIIANFKPRITSAKHLNRIIYKCISGLYNLLQQTSNIFRVDKATTSNQLPDSSLPSPNIITIIQSVRNGWDS